MKKKILMIALAAVLVAGAVVGGILAAKSIREKNYQKAEMASIKIPGFTEIEVKKNTEKVSLYLENPSGNPCSFVYEIAFKEGGDILYLSPSLAPGEAVSEVTLATALPEGRYPVTVKITTASLADGTPMNGASIDTVMVAR